MKNNRLLLIGWKHLRQIMCPIYIVIVLVFSYYCSILLADSLSGIVIKVSAGRLSSGDSFTISGQMDMSEAQLDSGPISIKAGPYEETITLVKKGRYYRYSAPKGGITSALFRPTRGDFKIRAVNVDLSGLSSPVTVELKKDDFEASAEASVKGSDLIYFNRNWADTLEVDKVRFRLIGQADNPKDSLQIQGRITLENTSTDLSNASVEINWGDYSVVLPAGSLVDIGRGRLHRWRYSSSRTNINQILFDFDKATFNIKVRNANIGNQYNPVTFNLKFDEFDQSVSVTDPKNPSKPVVYSDKLVVLGYNDLGMHCMNEDFSEFMILPPFNNLHAQVIERRGEEPRIITSGVTVWFSIPENATSVTKTNFWDYAPSLLGLDLASDIGITGTAMADELYPTGTNDWAAIGIPVTPLLDNNELDPFPLATIEVFQNSEVKAVTQAVVPVSWEISCNLCHNQEGVSTATDILQDHDNLHQTNLENSKPVSCGSCHEQEPLKPLGITGSPALPSLSRAMHSAHASRMTPILDQVNNVTCYACHPGIETQCLRGVHATAGMTCTNCHGSMNAVGDLTRQPWIDEPSCGSCHASNRPSYQFEQTGTLFKDSKGHHGVHCAACHGSPHAITPTITDADNIQATILQGQPGTISNCTVCHTRTPDEGFGHRYSGDDDD